MLWSLLLKKELEKVVLFCNFNIIFACGSDCHPNLIGDSSELWNWKINRGLNYLFLLVKFHQKKKLKIKKSKKNNVKNNLLQDLCDRKVCKDEYVYDEYFDEIKQCMISKKVLVVVDDVDTTKTLRTLQLPI